jgi:hypothetical protein
LQVQEPAILHTHIFHNFDDLSIEIHWQGPRGGTAKLNTIEVEPSNLIMDGRKRTESPTRRVSSDNIPFAPEYVSATAEQMAKPTEAPKEGVRPTLISDLETGWFQILH